MILGATMQQGSGGARLTCDEASDNKLYREHLTALHDDSIGVWLCPQSIGDDLLGPVHPPAAHLVQDLSLPCHTDKPLSPDLIAHP